MKSLLIFLSLILASSQEPENCLASIFPYENPFIGISGLTYLYFCQGWNIEDNVIALWHLNNTVYSNGDIDNVIIDNAPGVSTLAILDIKENFNNTEIACFVFYSDGRECNTTKSTFLVQGSLSPVASIDLSLNISCSSNGTLFLKWDSPFTLDLSNIENDIEYDVKIQSSEYSFQDVSGISDNSYVATIPTYNSNNVSCSLFNITITPFNLAGPGSSTAVTESALDSVDYININVTQGRYISNDQVIYTLHSNPAICDVEKVVLRDMNFGTNVILDENNINVTNDCSAEIIILIDTEDSDIYLNRHYNASYYLVNAARTYPPTNIINTYDIQSVIVDNVTRTLTIRLLKNSIAKGALLIVCPLYFKNPLFIFVPLDREAIMKYNIPSYMSDSMLLAFDIEDKGIIPPGINYPASDQIFISGSQNIMEKSISTNIVQCFMTIGMKVIVNSTCICEQLSTTESYQVFVLHHNDSNTKLYADSSNCFTGAIIEVEKNDTYYVAAFAIENNAGITTSSNQYSGTIVVGDRTKALGNQYWIIGVVIGATFICSFIIIVFAAVIHYKLHKNKNIAKTKSHDDSNISNYMVVSEEEDEVQHNTNM